MNAITALLALLIYCATLASADAIPPRQHRREVCPGATYFLRRDADRPKWARGRRPICRIGNHIFFDDLRSHETMQ